MQGIPVTPLLWPPLDQSASCLIKASGGDPLFCGPIPVYWSAAVGVNLSLHHSHHGLTHINPSKHFQLVNICSFCESCYSSTYHHNPLSPNPLTNILGLRLFYCIRENLLVMLVPAVNILLCHVHYSRCFHMITILLREENCHLLFNVIW